VAINRKYAAAGAERQSDFINCVAWRQTAEFVSKYFNKGSSICVIGSIQTSSSTDQSGQKRYFTDVVADEVNFVDAKGDSSARQSAAPAYTPDSYGTPSYSTGANAIPKFEEMSNDDDLPF
jgi:single-strand DNA-binding protein